MKQIIFTMLLMAFFAVGNNAIGGPIVQANCPQMDEAQGCLTPTAQGIVRIGITVQFPQFVRGDKNNPNLQNTDWSVVVSTSDPSQYTILQKSDFFYYGNGLYKFENTPFHTFSVPPNAQNYALILYLMAANNAFTIDSFSPPGGGFTICPVFTLGNDSRLANPGLEGTKNSSDEALNFQSLASLDNSGEYTIYPNPIVQDFTVEYQAVQNEETTFEIFDIEGHSIYTTQFNHTDTGLYARQFNDLYLTKGIYFCRIQAAKYQKTIKISKL